MPPTGKKQTDDPKKKPDVPKVQFYNPLEAMPGIEPAPVTEGEIHQAALEQRGSKDGF